MNDEDQIKQIARELVLQAPVLETLAIQEMDQKELLVRSRCIYVLPQGSQSDGKDRRGVSVLANLNNQDSSYYRFTPLAIS